MTHVSNIYIYANLSGYFNLFLLVVGNLVANIGGYYKCFHKGASV
jgi:hypothetical protein